jgi:D-glycero-alpha-D-manno-heptose 1-phosphate guanylyltransferase
VTTAVILAGGLGTRLRSAVPDLPKPLAPIHGRPFLEYQMDYWIEQGVDRFILSIGYLHEKVIEHFGDAYRGAKLECVIEDAPLGTGGGLMLALGKVSDTKSFLLLNGDTYFAVDLQRLAQFAREKKADWCFSLFKTSNAQRYLGLGLDQDRRITQLGVKDNEATSLANGGVYWVNTAVMLQNAFSIQFPVGAKASLEADIFQYELNRGARIFGLESDGEFLDIGIPEDYETSFSLFKKGNQ